MKTRDFSVKCTLVVPDTHFQPQLKNCGKPVRPDFCHDPAALSLLLQVAADRKPDAIIHLGDITEMASLSEWSKIAGHEGHVRGEDGQWYMSAWEDTIKMVESFWGYVGKAHPNTERTQLEGNHDFWAETAFSSPLLQPFTNLLHPRKMALWKDLKIAYHTYDGDQKKDQPWVDVGRVRVLHGYNNVSAQRMRLEHDNVVYGHQHKILYNSWDASSRETRRAWCIGCLTKLKPDYNSRGGQQNGWAQGFAIVYTMPDGAFNVRQVEIVDGRIVDFDGKTYWAKPLREISKMLKPLEML